MNFLSLDIEQFEISIPLEKLFGDFDFFCDIYIAVRGRIGVFCRMKATILKPASINFYFVFKFIICIPKVYV